MLLLIALGAAVVSISERGEREMPLKRFTPVTGKT